jgi:hypothetical protein
MLSLEVGVPCQLLRILAAYPQIELAGLEDLGVSGALLRGRHERTAPSTLSATKKGPGAGVLPGPSAGGRISRGPTSR